MGGGGGSTCSTSGVGGKRCRRTSAGKFGLDAAGAGVEEGGDSGEQEDEVVDVVVSEGWARRQTQSCGLPRTSVGTTLQMPVGAVGGAWFFCRDNLALGGRFFFHVCMCTPCPAQPAVPIENERLFRCRANVSDLDVTVGVSVTFVFRGVLPSLPSWSDAGSRTKCVVGVTFRSARERCRASSLSYGIGLMSRLGGVGARDSGKNASRLFRNHGRSTGWTSGASPLKFVARTHTVCRPAAGCRLGLQTSTTRKPDECALVSRASGDRGRDRRPHVCGAAGTGGSRHPLRARAVDCLFLVLKAASVCADGCLSLQATYLSFAVTPT